jgi:hypothetical protein
MHTHGMFGEHVSMTSSTVHRIEPAPVPAFPADVAVEAFRQTVRSALEVNQINFVAIVTGILFLSVGCLQPEQQAGDQESEGLMHASHNVSSN